MELANMAGLNTHLQVQLADQVSSNGQLSNTISEHEQYFQPLKAENIGLKQQLEVLLKDHERLSLVSAEHIDKVNILNNQLQDL